MKVSAPRSLVVLVATFQVGLGLLGRADHFLDGFIHPTFNGRYRGLLLDLFEGRRSAVIRLFSLDRRWQLYLGWWLYAREFGFLP